MTKSSASRSRTAGASLFNSARFQRFSIAMIFESCATANHGNINHSAVTTRLRFIGTPAPRAGVQWATTLLQDFPSGGEVCASEMGWGRERLTNILLGPRKAGDYQSRYTA